MDIKFKDINPGIYLAEVTEIKNESGPYGSYLRFNFTVTDGELKGWSFYGIVKPNHYKQTKFYRWITTIMDQEPQPNFSFQDMVGKVCQINLIKTQKNQKTYYSVKDIVH